MSHLALYRKYRSQTFGDLVGQEHITRTLQSAIARGKISHSYLFTGPRGTGKTSTARLLAKALNCENGPAAEPCNECNACKEITIGNCLDVVEMDAASESGVEAVRTSIVEAVDYQPAYCRYRIFIIDEVHDLSRQAFDALLKTIEEPPGHVVFILATTEFAKVPPTVRSRCQRYEFHRGTIQDLVGRLKYVVDQEGVETEPAALTAIARMSDGGFRDALTLLEQAVLTTEGTITLQLVYDQLGLVADEIVDTLLAQMQHKDIVGLMASLEAVYRTGRDPRSLLESVLYRLAELTRAAYGVESDGLGDATQEAALKSTSTSLGTDRILSFRAAMAEAHKNIRDVTIPRIWLEAELIRISLGPAEPSAPVVEVARPKPVPVEKPQPKVEPRPAEVAKVAEPKPVIPVVVIEPTDDPQLANARQLWANLTQEMAVQSAVARERLIKTRVDRIEGHLAMVEFASAMVMDLVVGSRLEKAIRESWAKVAPDGVELTFFLGTKTADQRAAAAGQAAIESTAVELPAEGERLVEMVHEVFGTGERSSE